MEPTELHTERLVLRPFRMGDVDDVFAYEADEQFSRYVALAPWPYAHDDAIESCRRSSTCDWAQDAVFAIDLAGSVIGSTNLMLDLPNLVAQLGYAVAPKHWRNGFAREAVGGLLDWAFPTYSLVRVFAHCDMRHDRSWQLLERLGMTREGLIRSATRTTRGELRDEFVYGLLREEWEADQS